MSEIFVEKMEHVAGIYLIFNMKSKKVYIGKSKMLKQRALKHVRDLYFQCDNNKELQNEFTNGSDTFYLGKLCETENVDELDLLESKYYLAACEECGIENVYNTKKLPGIFEREEINEAKSKIRDTLAKKIKRKHGKLYKNCNKMKDWIDLEDINLSECEKQKMKKKIKSMIDNHEIDFLLLGKAGDYIGNNGIPQTLTSILNEKIGELKCEKNDIENKCCLWATYGPSLEEFSKYFSLYKKMYGNDKKLFVLFKLTVNDSKNINKKNEQKYYWEKDGMRYFCTAPERENAKALVIRNFYFIEEDFDFELFSKMYYRLSPATYFSNEKKYKLNSENLSRLTMYLGGLKSAIINGNEELIDSLGFYKAPYLMDEFNKKIEKNNIQFDNVSQHPIYYLLAEVEDYVKVEQCK